MVSGGMQSPAAPMSLPTRHAAAAFRQSCSALGQVRAMPTPLQLEAASFFPNSGGSDRPCQWATKGTTGEEEWEMMQGN